MNSYHLNQKRVRTQHSDVVEAMSTFKTKILKKGVKANTYANLCENWIVL